MERRIRTAREFSSRPFPECRRQGFSSGWRALHPDEKPCRRHSGNGRDENSRAVLILLSIQLSDDFLVYASFVDRFFLMRFKKPSKQGLRISLGDREQVC